LDSITQIAEKARRASYELSTLSTQTKNDALHAMADALQSESALILTENEKDLDAGRSRDLSKAMLDRLELSENRLAGIADGLRDVAALSDPVGETIRGWKNPNGLEIQQVRTPLGVIAMVYESRPNVTADAAGLALKAGSACILRGGSEAVHSNRVLAGVLSQAATSAGIPANAIQLVPTQEHEVVKEMLQLNDLIDLVIPRGGERLINMVVENSKIPVIKHFRGMVHVYIDEHADDEKAVAVAVNSKTQRPSTCNSCETILVHAAKLDMVPSLVKGLEAKDVEVRGDERVKSVASNVVATTDEDWSTEYLDLVVSIRVVDSMDEALNHIRQYSSGLAESIVTEDYTSGRRFHLAVDSAAVYINASTRFTDGAEFGLGAEIGITTDKIFPRGPMGLRELTSSKYVIFGDGQIRG